MSLRWFHLVFLLIVIMGAELFGGWSMHEYFTAGDGMFLALGVTSLLGGLGLAGYIFWFVRKTERAHLT